MSTVLVVCPECEGEGRIVTKTCNQSTCGGRNNPCGGGCVLETEPCERCDGTGSVIPECAECGGRDATVDRDGDLLCEVCDVTRAIRPEPSVVGFAGPVGV